jgi:hypothetical protein
MEKKIKKKFAQKLLAKTKNKLKLFFSNKTKIL